MEPLVANEIAQWLGILFTASFSLAAVRLAASQAGASPEIQGSYLRGIRVGQELLTNLRTGTDLVLSELIDRRPAVMLVTDPSCANCDRRVQQLLKSESWPLDRTVVVVRGDRAVGEAYAKEVDSSVRVVGECAGLALRPLSPPFATIVDAEGGYAGYENLDDDAGVRRLLGTLAAHDARAAMVTDLASLQG